MPFGGTISADDYFAGTRAAACGGTTTVFDFILQNYDEPMVDAIKRRDALCAPKAAVDYAFHIAVKDVHGGLIDTMADAVAYGVPSFKVFMVYDFGVTDGVFYQVLEKSKEIGAQISVHAENNQLVTYLTQRYLSEGKTDAWYHYMSPPRICRGRGRPPRYFVGEVAGRVALHRPPRKQGGRRSRHPRQGGGLRDLRRNLPALPELHKRRLQATRRTQLRLLAAY